MVSPMRLANRFPILLLRSPLHGLLSDGVLLITFTGRKSGKRYTTPINYLQDGDTVDLTTDSPWWKNLRSGAPVTLRIKGRDRRGTAEPVTDPVEVERVLRAMLARFPRYGKPAHIRTGPDGKPDAADVARAITTDGRVVVRVRLAPSAMTDTAEGRR